jgi:hypothetical protein
MASMQNRERQKISTSIGSDESNSEAVFRALSEFGAPLDGLNPADFVDGSTFQIGQPPARIDLLQQFDGIGFEEAWKNRIQGLIDGDIPVMVISRKDLIRIKVASGREQDVLDAKKLQTASEDL